MFKIESIQRSCLRRINGLDSTTLSVVSAHHFENVDQAESCTMELPLSNSCPNFRILSACSLPTESLTFGINETMLQMHSL